MQNSIVVSFPCLDLRVKYHRVSGYVKIYFLNVSLLSFRLAHLELRQRVPHPGHHAQVERVNLGPALDRPSAAEPPPRLPKL